MSGIPRSISWDDVRRVLEMIDRRTPIGRRDYAILLLLVTYGLRAREVAALTPDILTCPGSFLTIFGPRFDVEAEGERGFWDWQVTGVQLLAQGHQGRGVARGTELIEVDMELAVG